MKERVVLAGEGLSVERVGEARQLGELCGLSWGAQPGGLCPPSSRTPREVSSRG